LSLSNKCYTCSSQLSIFETQSYSFTEKKINVKICPRCNTSLFIIDETLETILKTKRIPDEYLEGIKDLYWLCSTSPDAFAYFNVAEELLELFLLDEVEFVFNDDIIEANYSTYSLHQIIGVLEEAKLVDIRGDKIYPGAVMKQIIGLRLQKIPLDSKDMESTIQAYKSILSLVIIKNRMFSDYKPRGALVILHNLSELVNEAIKKGKNVLNELNGDDFDKISAESKSPKRQQKKIKRKICGFSDGYTKLIEDYENDNLIFKDYVVNFLDRIRERILEREREIEREVFEL